MPIQLLRIGFGHLFLVALTIAALPARNVCASSGKEFKVTPLAGFVEPEKLKQGDYAIEKIQPGIVKVTPRRGQKSVRLELLEPIRIDDDSAWFSIPYYPVASNYVTERNPQGYRVTLITPSGLGEAGLNTRSFAYRRDHQVKRGWQNLISESTLLQFHESRRKGMKASALVFTIDDNVESFYFATPRIYSGDIMNPELASAYAGYSNTWYGEMTPIRPFYFRAGAYECGLTIQNGYQKKPIYETSRSFDFGPDSGAGFNPIKALDGFALPVMPKGVYWCTLRFRNTDGTIIQQESFDYEVLASPATELPKFADIMPAAGELITFVPAHDDFIFDAGNSVNGKINVADLNDKPWMKENDKLAVYYYLTEFRHQAISSIPEKVYAKGMIPAKRGGVALDLSLPVSDEMAPSNTAFVLKLDLMIGGKTLDSTSYVIGARGKNNAYIPLEGTISTWQDTLKKPILGEGPHPLIYMPDEDREEFLARLKNEGNSEYIDVDCMWSAGTEPLPGFYTFGYIDRFVAALHRHGFKAIMHTTGIGPAPAWSLFTNSPSKLHDGRFLRGDNWNGISPFAEYPGAYIRNMVLRVGQRYAKEPTVGFWVFWGYGGEGFFPDWALSWRYGGGKIGYCDAGVRLYRETIRQKYKTIEALNAAYGTAYADWSQVLPPPPPVEQETTTNLRNPKPAYSHAYEDFKAMKDQFQRDYYEGFLVREFRKVDPVRALAIYYYCDAETEFMRSSPEFFSRNPGIIQRNGGNEIAGVWNKQYMHFRAYENTPTMSEDNAVYADTVKDWESNVFNGARIGKLGSHFFNYSYLASGTRDGKKSIHTDHHHAEIAAFFQTLKAYALPLMGDSEPLPSGVAVYYNYYDNTRTSTTPANDLFYSRYLAEPINDRFLSRLQKHYRVLLMDSGAQVIPQAQSIVDWVKNGGVLVMTPATAAWKTGALSQPDPDTNPVTPPLKHENYLLNELGIPLPKTGMWGTKIKGDFSAHATSGSIWPAEAKLAFRDGYSTYVFPKDAYPQAQVLARFTAPSEIAGQPAALMFTLGQGRVILLAQYPRVESGDLYDTMMGALKVNKHLAFRRSADDREPPFRSILGYALETSDGSRLLMMQHANSSPDPHFTPAKMSETEPFERRVVTFGLADGRYEVFDLMDGNRSLGVLNAQELAVKGVPARFRYNELKIYRVVRK